MDITISTAKTTAEWVIAEANKGWRVGPKQAELYRTKLAKLNERLPAAIGTRQESSIRWEINELELKLQYWVN